MNVKTKFNHPNKQPRIRQKSFNRTIATISIITALIVVVTLSQLSIRSISASTPTIQEMEQQFNLDTTYAYVGKGTSNSTVTDSQGKQLQPISQYPSAVYFNVTKPKVENAKYDAIIEVFKVTIASDKGSNEEFIFFTGTNCKASFSDVELNRLTNSIHYLFDVNYFDGVSGMFCHNWSDNESFSAKVGSYGTYTNYKNDRGLWNAGKPNSISVTFHRIGYATITNGAISLQSDVTSVNNKAQVQLQEYNDGFLKNEIVPLDKLSQKNQFEPFK